MVKLGQYVKDTVTGFTGVVIMQGHTRSAVQPRCKEGGAIKKYELIDTAQLVGHEDNQVDLFPDGDGDV